MGLIFREGVSVCGINTAATLWCSAANDLEGAGRVVVTAFMTASHRVDTDVEKIVGRLSLELTVSTAESLS